MVHRILQGKDIEAASQTDGSHGSTDPSGTLETEPGSPSNDEVLYVGLNPRAAWEATFLRAAGASVTQVLNAVAPAQVQYGSFRTGRKTADLTTQEGVVAFVETFKLPDTAQAKAVVAAIWAGEPKIRDELARIAEVWAKAERGSDIPSRLMLSGHSTGDGPWGTGNGQIHWPVFEQLVHAFPRAAARVEDVHLAMCRSARDQAFFMIDLFPNLRTFWGYEGSAPSTFDGAFTHFRLWEDATKGQKAELTAEFDGKTRNVAWDTHKGKEVLVWSRDEGFVGIDHPPIDEIRKTLTQYQDLIDVLSGEATGPGSPDKEPVSTAEVQPRLGDFFSALQSLMIHPEFTDQERDALRPLRRKAFELKEVTDIPGLILTPDVVATIDLAALNLGLERFDFSRRTWAELDVYRAEVEAVRARGGRGHEELFQRAADLLDSLAAARRDVIPAHWTVW